jgi:hypothetical protein
MNRSIISKANVNKYILPFLLETWATISIMGIVKSKMLKSISMGGRSRKNRPEEKIPKMIATLTGLCNIIATDL